MEVKTDNNRQSYHLWLWMGFTYECRAISRSWMEKGDRARLKAALIGVGTGTRSLDRISIAENLTHNPPMI